jgi:hypothetical protein
MEKYEDYTTAKESRDVTIREAAAFSEKIAQSR